MMVKAIKVLNTGSVILFIGVVVLIYAFLPISVDLNIEGVSNIHKQQFFYYAVAGFIVINFLLRLIIAFGFKNSNDVLTAWISGLVFVVNVYYCFLIGFTGVWNNSTHISPSSYSYLNFLGPTLLIIWVGGLIFLARKK